MLKFFAIVALVLALLAVACASSRASATATSQQLKNKNSNPQLVLQAEPAYNYTLAIDGLNYARLSYCDGGDIASWSCATCQFFPGMRNVTTVYVEAHASFGWCGFDATNNRIVVSFRGTVNPQGWIEDFDFFKTPYTEDPRCVDCNVHQGLYWGYLEVMKVLMPRMLALTAAHPDAEVWSVGHSMGGAQAGFAQPDVIRKLVTKGKKRTFTFGEPRIGNVNFVKWQQTVLQEHESWRMTNYGDPVPHLPPLIFDELDLGKWIHNPREIFYKDAFGSPAAFKVCDGNYTYEDPTCADSTPLFSFSFKYHTTYLGMPMGCFSPSGEKQH